MGVVIQRLDPKAWKEVRKPMLPHTARCDDHAWVGRRGSGFDVGYQARVGREESAHDAAEDARDDQLDPVIAQCPSQPGAGPAATSWTCLLPTGQAVRAGWRVACSRCIARRFTVAGGLGVVRLMCVRGQDCSPARALSAGRFGRSGRCRSSRRQWSVHTNPPAPSRSMARCKLSQIPVGWERARLSLQSRLIGKHLEM